MHDTVGTAIIRKKQIKTWNQAWKIELIEQDNPDWRDLDEDLNTWADAALPPRSPYPLRHSRPDRE